MRCSSVVPVKTQRGEPGHTTDTHGHGRARGSHRRTSRPSKPTKTPATAARQPNPRPTQQPHLCRSPSSPGAERSPRPTQKRPPPANPTRPPPAPRAPPRACSKAVGEMKARTGTVVMSNFRLPQLDGHSLPQSPYPNPIKPNFECPFPVLEVFTGKRLLSRPRIRSSRGRATCVGGFGWL